MRDKLTVTSAYQRHRTRMCWHIHCRPASLADPATHHHPMSADRSPGRCTQATRRTKTHSDKKETAHKCQLHVSRSTHFYREIEYVCACTCTSKSPPTRSRLNPSQNASPSEHVRVSHSTMICPRNARCMLLQRSRVKRQKSKTEHTHAHTRMYTHSRTHTTHVLPVHVAHTRFPKHPCSTTQTLQHITVVAPPM